MENQINLGDKFKSISAIEYLTDRGEDFGQVEGTVISIEKNRINLRGLMFDFSITKSEFLNSNKF